MSAPIDDGGPAFPGEQGHIPDGTWNQTWCSGMSLRDWFAGQALAWMLGDANRLGTFEDFATDAYGFADAMLAARKVKP